MDKEKMLANWLDSDYNPLIKLRMAVYANDVNATMKAMSMLVKSGAEEKDVRELAEALSSLDKIAGKNDADETAIVQHRVLPDMLKVEHAIGIAA